MKSFPPGLLVLSLLSLATSSLFAQTAETLTVPLIENGDFSNGTKGWIATFPKEAKPYMDVSPKGYEGKPCLTLQLPTCQVDSWSGKLTTDLSLESGNRYTLTFRARCQPEDCHIQVSVWGKDELQKDHQVDKAHNARISSIWGEVYYEFSIEASMTDFTLDIRNLAKSDETFEIAEVTIVRN